MTTIARRRTPSHEHVDPPVDATVYVGVDTHRDTHTAAVIDATGRHLADHTFTTDPAGYTALLQWASSFGPVALVGIEGTGAYGAGLARYLHTTGTAMVDIDRPDRKTRRFAGKSDPIDAYAAARAALAGTQTGTPKNRDSPVEALRALRVARRSAVTGRADCIRQIKTLLVNAPDHLREHLRHLRDRELLATCAALRPDPGHAADPTQAVKIALRALARRHRYLTQDIEDLDELIEPLIASINPDLMTLNGVGPDTAGALLVTAGANPERVTSEASFAMLCGVAPIPASSGRTHRHRLNRGGDRQANAALYRIVLCRLRWDPRTRHYMQRRTQEGLSKKDIIRCLKRLIAREIYYVLQRPHHATTPQPTAA